MLESDIASLLPLSSLWAETTGSPEVLIAVLDSPADLSHPCFAGASLRSLGSEDASAEAVQGIAPRCAGLIIHSSEIKLASAILQAVRKNHLSD